jgi:Sulfate permease and related transporters (MFS superfamily)
MFREFKLQQTALSSISSLICSVYTGLLVILSLLFLTQLFFFIPKAALAAIIIAAVIFMIEVNVVIPIWKTKSEYISYVQGLGKQNIFEQSHNSK